MRQQAAATLIFLDRKLFTHNLIVFDGVLEFSVETAVSSTKVFPRVFARPGVLGMARVYKSSTDRERSRDR